MRMPNPSPIWFCRAGRPNSPASGQPEQPVERRDFDDVARAVGVADPGFEDPQAVLPEGLEPGLAALHLAVELVGQVATHEALAGQGDAGVPRPALALPVGDP